jgi:hypothetical protein
VPVKDNAAQSISFALCAFGLAFETIRLWRAGRKTRGAIVGSLAGLFLANIFIIYFSKTGVLVAGALATLFLVRTNGGRRNLAGGLDGAFLRYVRLTGCSTQRSGSVERPASRRTLLYASQ